MSEEEKEQKQIRTENQFEEISAMVQKNQSISHFQHNEFQSQLDEENAKNRQEVNSFYQKLKYYNSLVKQNKQMHADLERLSKGLDKKIELINSKKYATVNKYKPQVKPQRSQAIQAKYRVLDEYKNQLEFKMLQKNSVEELICRIDQLKALHKQKYVQLQFKVKTLKKLQQMASKKKVQSEKLASSSLLVTDSCLTEIKSLKDKIKATTSKVHEQRQKLINVAKSRKKSSLELTPSKQSIQHQQTIQISELKLEYEAIGKRIQVLKAQKKTLSQSTDLKQRKRVLQKLKAKYVELTKI